MAGVDQQPVSEGILPALIIEGGRIFLNPFFVLLLAARSRAVLVIL